MSGVVLEKALLGVAGVAHGGASQAVTALNELIIQDSIVQATWGSEQTVILMIPLVCSEGI